MQAPRVLAPLLLCMLTAAGGSLAGEAQVAPAETAAPNADADSLHSALLATPAPAPRWSASGALEEGGYRLSLSRGALDLGIRFDARVAAARPIDGRFDSAAPAGVMLPSLSFGLRTVAAPPPTANSLAERALGTSTTVPEVSKFGIEWKPAQPEVFFHQGVGFRLGGDDRLVMRLRKSSLGIYMQRTF